METSAENTPTCPSCNQPRLEGHVCAPGQAQSTADETARIEIPEALRNTGLFRAAWNPSTQRDDAVRTGNIFQRDPEATDSPVTAPEPAPDDAPVADPWAGLDVTLGVPQTPEKSDPWADLTPSAPEPAPEHVSIDSDDDLSAEAPAEVPEASELEAPVETPEEAPVEPHGEATDLGRDPRLDEFGDEFDEFDEAEPDVEQPQADLTQTQAEAAALSPIAAAEVAALQAEDREEPHLDLEATAAYDLEGDFAREAAAQDALEPVPTPEQSAYDLYGDSLYAPSPDDEADTPAQGTTIAPATEATAIAGTPLLPASEPAPPFASGLSEEGLTSASLPASVPFGPDSEHGPGESSDAGAQSVDPVAPHTERRAKRRRRNAIVATVLVIVLVAGAGTWWWSTRQDAPVKEAFATSHDSFLIASDRLDRAASIADIAEAGAAFDRSLTSLNATADVARESGSPVATAAHQATLAETAVAEAAASLKDLSVADLSAWTSAKEPLTAALEELEDVTGDVETAGGSTNGMPTPAVIAHTQDVIAAEIVDGATATVVDLSAKLESASLLADIRAVGASAGEYVTALSEALTGVEDPQQKSDLNAVVEFHESLSKFTKVRSSAFDIWKDLRKDAEAAARELASGVEEAQSGIKAADAVVSDAQAKFEAWETKHAAAKAKKAADAKALTDAIAAVTSADSSYSRLYGELESLVNEVSALPAAGTEGEAYTRLNAAAKAREDLLAQLDGFSLVPNSAKRLDALKSALKSDADAVRAAARAAGSCVDACSLAATPEVRALGTVTAEAAQAWNDAMGPWESTTTAAAEKIADRKLPKRPKI